MSARAIMPAGSNSAAADFPETRRKHGGLDISNTSRIYYKHMLKIINDPMSSRAVMTGALLKLFIKEQELSLTNQVEAFMLILY